MQHLMIYQQNGVSIHVFHTPDNLILSQLIAIAWFGAAIEKHSSA